MRAPPLGDMIAIAVMAERRTIEQALQRAGGATDDVDDLVQSVALFAVQAAQDDRLAWERRPTLRRWLYLVALRRGRDHVRRAELRARHESTHEDDRLAPSVEELYLRRETLRVAARSTTPERWRALRAWASGVHVADIARRERIAVPTVYNRIRLAREDIRKALRRC